MVKRIETVGEVTITGKNQVSLPARGLRQLGWERGDHLLASVAGDDMMILMRRPHSWTDAFAGRLGHVFGTHEDTLRWLEEERRSWERDTEDQE
jgi:bifunctional DNA-binding transcriptional regulator/antitoxin component of YhaV-PrlF toxin-antitoxin module